jgi:hypothetical protein
VIIIFEWVVTRGTAGTVVRIKAVLSISKRVQVVDEFDDEES